MIITLYYMYFTFDCDVRSARGGIDLKIQVGGAKNGYCVLSVTFFHYFLKNQSG